MINRSEISGLLTGFALVACGLLACAYIDFDIPGQALLESLRLHLAGLILVLGLCLLAVRAGWRGCLFAAIAIASAGQDAWNISRLQAARPDDVVLAADSVKLLHFNVLGSNSENGEAIAQLIAGSDADVVSVLEAGPVQPFLDDLAATYPYRVGCDDERHCDLMVLSRHPLSDVQVLSLSPLSAQRLIVAVADFEGRRVNLVAVHLTKPYFDDAAMGETWRLGQLLAEMEGPVVVAGDFNAAIWSDNLQRVMRAGGLLAGPDLPSTWPTFFGAFGVPIDNVLARAPARITSLQALSDPMGSNHRGLVAQIALLDE